VDLLAELSVNSSQFTFLPIFYIHNTEQIGMKLFYRNIRTLSLRFLEDYAGEDTDKVLEHFFAYLHQTGPFQAMNACRGHTSNPSTCC
jgi:hypothetical protein